MTNRCLTFFFDITSVVGDKRFRREVVDWRVLVFEARTYYSCLWLFWRSW
jgi:hypothetical protein